MKAYSRVLNAAAVCVHAGSEPPTETEAINGEWYLGVGELAPELLTDDEVDEADAGCTATDLFDIGV